MSLTGVDHSNNQRGGGPRASLLYAWLTGTVSFYNLSSEIRTVEQGDGRYSLGMVVSGDFPGSPYAFDYRFLLHGEKIAELAIGPVGPVLA